MTRLELALLLGPLAVMLGILVAAGRPLLALVYLGAWGALCLAVVGLTLLTLRR